MKDDEELVKKGYYAWLKENNLKDTDENTATFVLLWRKYGLDK